MTPRGGFNTLTYQPHLDRLRDDLTLGAMGEEAVVPATADQIARLQKVREEFLVVMKLWNSHAVAGMTEDSVKKALENVTAWQFDTVKACGRYYGESAKVPITSESAESLIAAGKSFISKFKQSLAWRAPVTYAKNYGWDPSAFYPPSAAISHILQLCTSIAAIPWRFVIVPAAKAVLVTGKVAVAVAQDVGSGLQKTGETLLGTLEFLRKALPFLIVGAIILYAAPTVMSQVRKARG
jgi:hypothetical protein